MSDDHDNEICNKTDNRPFADILDAATSRRKVLAGGLGLAATGFFASNTVLAGGWGESEHREGFRRHRKLIDFEPVAVADGNGPWPTISADYEYQVLIPWGDPLEPGGPEFNYPPNADDQTKQIGIGHDGMHYFPIDRFRGYRDDDWDDDRHPFRRYRWRRGNWHGMLVINHEFGTNPHVLGKQSPESLEDVRVSQHAHGVSVVEIKKSRGVWRTVKSHNARRIHVNTPVTFSGPVAGHPLLQTPNGNIPLGTVNNCSNGHTPWGTYLTCEENFNGYFGATNRDTVWMPTAAQERYGFSETGFGYGWYNFDRRFDLSDVDYVNEENRFGWVVEIDPMDATQKPVKRTALGRFKHEGVALTIGQGRRAVAYMGDDQRFDYIYKFVSADDYRHMLHQGESPLDRGQLFVARFNDDGSGEWLELTIDNPQLAAAFNDQAEVLTYARMAADILGATPMDRPEWTTVAPNGDVYCTLTNNSRRTEANAANPLAPNPDGHIIKWRDSDKHTGLTFEWEIFLIAADTHGTEDTFSDPDGLWADPAGRLFIQTDGGQKDGLNNQMLVADTRTGELRRLFTGVAGDEITGITVTPDRRTMFINTQHPGNGDPSVTNFPAPLDGVTVPRDATFVITRKDGGIIGS
ncbi:PhoX family phosphatase [Exilibacterium tricleocarpae]|uniref:PhoX family phosphatase n=1 Tax=Exilibacterium tricleocarpae TaxID=2591008 RepID=A0A545TAH4_9GAMM|nr:PhoX family phosphatase [Exilibacterium tricleocarpae]TQV74194.1 PhoX family phosphatase [Exilibacterium tricleocarpae]